MSEISVTVNPTLRRIVEVGGNSSLSSSINDVSNRLVSTGTYLSSLITASSAGVSTLNSLSGIISLTGKGNVSIITGVGIINISGNTGIYSTFITTGQTGAFGGSANTGALTGAFYPLGANPSGFITSGQTGAFATSVNTGVLTGVFYPLALNPSGYLTGFSSGLYTLNSQTGQFYASSNPNNYITGFNSGLFTLDSETGNLADQTYVQNASGTLNTRISSTGSNLLGQINTLNSWTGISTGLYYPYSSNPNSYVTGSVVRPTETGNFADQGYVGIVSGALSTRMQTTGNTLLGLIQAASAGVSSLNGSSGILTLAGAGNVTVSTNGQTITVSGNTGIYSTFITTGQTGAFGGSSNTGVLTGTFYPLTANPSNYIANSGFITGFLNGQSGSSGIASGIVSNQIQFYGITGASGIAIDRVSGVGALAIVTTGLVYSSATGNFVTSNNTGSFITSSQTGAFYAASNPNSYTTISAVDAVYYPRSNPNSYATSGNLLSTGSSLQTQVNSITSWTGITPTLYYPSGSNPSGYITGLNTGSFITSSQTGAFISTGMTGNFVTTSQTGSLINQGMTGNYADKGYVSLVSGVLDTRISSTGSSNLTQINTLNSWTGITPTLFAPIIHTHNYPTGIGVSGSIPITGLVTLTGIGGLNVILSGNIINFSGGAGGGTTNNNTYVNSGTGIFTFRSGIASGVSQQFIAFPYALDSKPLILASLHNDLFSTILSSQISGSSTSGFYSVLSNTTNNTGYYLDIWASNSTTTGMATIVINATGGGGSTDISNLTGCRNAQFGIVIDAGSAVIASGFKGYTRIPTAMTIAGWELIGNTSGLIQIDIWKTGFATYPPTISNTIVGGNYPTLSGVQISNYTGTVSSWVTSCNKGDYIGFTVNSGVSGISRVNLSVFGVSI